MSKSQYDTMTLDEIIYDFGYVRGDLSEKYARDFLVVILEKREAALRAELAERDELAAKVADAWDEALDHAGFESHEVRMNLVGATDWNRVEDLILSHLGAMQDANPYRQAQS